MSIRVSLPIVGWNGYWCVRGVGVVGGSETAGRAGLSYFIILLTECETLLKAFILQYVIDNQIIVCSNVGHMLLFCSLFYKLPMRSTVSRVPQATKLVIIYQCLNHTTVIFISITYGKFLYGLAPDRPITRAIDSAVT